MTATQNLELKADSIRKLAQDAILKRGTNSILAVPSEQNILAFADGVAAYLCMRDAESSSHTSEDTVQLQGISGHVSYLAFNAAEFTGSQLLALTGTQAFVYSVSSQPTLKATLLGSIESSGTAPWKTAAWHPAVPITLALLSSQEIAVVKLVPTSLGATFNTVLRQPAPEVRTAGPLALAWSGNRLMISIGSTVQFITPYGAEEAVIDASPSTQQNAAHAALSSSAEPAPAASTTGQSAACEQASSLLLGLGGPLRTLCSGPGGAIFGTIDATLAFESPASALEDRSAQAHGVIADDQRLGSTDSAVIDLRGKLAGDAAPPVPSLFNIHQAGGPDRLVLAGSHKKAVAAQPAQVALVWPGHEETATASTSGRPDAWQAQCALPIPDIFKVLGSLGIVASSSGPPIALVARLSAAGVLPLMRVELRYPDMESSDVRIRGLSLRWKAMQDRRRALSITSLVALPRSAPGPSFLGSTLPPADLFLASHTLPLHAEDYDIPPSVSAAAAPAAAAMPSQQSTVRLAEPAAGVPTAQQGPAGLRPEAESADATFALMRELTSSMGQMMQTLERSMGAGFDRLEGQLRGFEARLSSVESQVAAAAGGDPGDASFAGGRAS